MQSVVLQTYEVKHTFKRLLINPIIKSVFVDEIPKDVNLFLSNSSAFAKYSVAQQLKKNGFIDQVGGAFYLAQLTNKVKTTSHLEYHARIIAQEYLKRKIIRLGSEMQSKGYEKNEDISDIIDWVERQNI